MPKPPSSRVGERSEPWAETNRPRLAWSRTRSPAPVQTGRMSPFVAPTRGVGRCRPSIGWMPLQPARSKGEDSFPAFRSFPLCYTAGRHEGARREGKVELMTEPADRAVLLLQRVSELLLESRAIVQQLEAVPDGESSADTGDRIAYGILVAALEEGLVTTIRHALDVLKRFSRPAGVLGEEWLSEQERKLEQDGQEQDS